MSDKAWKQRERKAAAAFGARRTVGSGSLGRDDRTCSDSTHPSLFIETKLRMKHSVITLFDKVAHLAKREKKTPVVLLAEKHKPSFWVLCRLEDLDTVADEYRRAEETAKKAREDLPGQQTFI